uniref:Putative secreted protein n=1 Tax=Ixodes ricinus TaxID=34613 RepID=A0A6B0U3D7_IXORI
MCALSRSLSTMSSMLLSWQKIRARWACTTLSCSPPDELPMPQSSSSCLRAPSLAACPMSDNGVLFCSRLAWMRSYSGCWALSTNFGWLHTLRRY